MQEELIYNIDAIIVELQKTNTTGILDFIIHKYELLKNKILENDLNHNIIKGSVRAYLDAKNDYYNPVLTKMHALEIMVDEYLNQ